MPKPGKMSDGKETYMLTRDKEESQRLDAQHEYMRQMSSGHLVHPSIPIRQLKRVADVATGTGVWLRQLADDPAFNRPPEEKPPVFIGFDISSQQFPTEDRPLNVNFHVHDFVDSFPAEWHEYFDLVNVRLVSYAIKGVDLEKVVRNIIQLLRK